MAERVIIFFEFHIVGNVIHVLDPLRKRLIQMFPVDLPGIFLFLFIQIFKIDALLNVFVCGFRIDPAFLRDTVLCMRHDQSR